MDIAKDPFLAFAKSLDVSRLKVTNFPAYIFLCGGPCDLSDPNISSVRKCLLSHLKSNHPDLHVKVLLAETFQYWNDDGLYSSLQAFEHGLAGLAACVVIIVESAGAIAELGYFVNVDSVQNKLLLILSQKHYEQKSFIRLGPVAHCEKETDGKVVAYPWNGSLPVADFEAEVSGFVEHIAEDIRRQGESYPKSRSFNPKDEGHILLIICDLLDLFHVARSSEIERVLIQLGVLKPDVKVMDRLLLLINVGLVGCEMLGDHKFYHLIKNESYMQYYFMSEAKIRERLAWKVEFRNWPGVGGRRKTALKRYLASKEER